MSKLPNPKLFKSHSVILNSPIKRQSSNTITLPRQQLEKEFNSFEMLTREKHLSELVEVSPAWLLNQADSTDIDLFRAMSRYDQRNNTFITGCFNNEEFDFKLISYKRRRLHGGKWITRKDTHPNSTIFHRIYKDDAPIFIVEGHRDSLTAVLLGLNFIMLPTASYRGAEAVKKVLTGDDEVIFLVEDRAAYTAMRPLAETITAGTIKLKQLQQGVKMDLSDFTYTKHNIEEVVKCLL